MNEFKVGLLTIISCVAVAFMSLKITSNQSGFGEYVPYETVLEDASGIFPKTPIKIAGINAGRITDIILEGNKALVKFEVLRRVNVTVGSSLRIKTVGMLGDKFIELSVNLDTDKRLGPNERMETKASAGLDKLAENASEVLADVKEIVREFKASLMPPGQKESEIKKIIRSVAEMTESANKVAHSLERMAVGNEGRISAIIKNLESASARINKHLNSDDEESLMSGVQEVVANANAITKDLQEVINNVKNGKGTVGQLLSEDEIADEIKETLAGVSKIVNKVNEVKTEVQVYTGANTDSGWKTDAEIWIYPSPERFFIIGATSSEEGTSSEKTTETTTGGVTTIEDEKKTEKNTYTFTAQMGRKLHGWYFRGGMIESTAGFGVDYEFQRYGIKLTSEIFDFNFDDGMNARLKAEYRLWNILYARVSGERLTESNASATFSIGFRLLDEDLKGIFGLLL